MSLSVRVRFAPAPTGMMHLGNVRQALINFLFAQQKKGVFVLRIEDTDTQRMFDIGAHHIQADLKWLGISYDEGPEIEGPYGPYFQSQRTPIYQEYLKKLQASNDIYRCFCSTEELERKRQRQIMLKQAPRYDRTCLHLSQEIIAHNIAQHIPFVWRFKLRPEKITITDLAHGSIDFDLINFSDFPITRQDESFTFIFANCIDDITMHITHIFRGEDHLSNSANQAMIYKALHAPIPVFWHAPIMCNHEGKKLSKRDFGFSLNDLRNAGFVPEAIVNYLASIGTKTAAQEIMNTQELVSSIDFSHYSATSTVRYDEDKLRWMNHAWVQRLPLRIIVERCRPILEEHYPQVASMSYEELQHIIRPIQNELHTLADVVPLVHGCFHIPVLDRQAFVPYELASYQPILKALIIHLNATQSVDELINLMKNGCRQNGLATKSLWSIIRLALTGSAEGTSIKNLLEMIGRAKIIDRIERLIDN
jgi:nondiscriminating glutamyl-tRNA synthetase